jgi:hypothetical protein
LASSIIDQKLADNPEGSTFDWGSLGPAILRSAVQKLDYKHLSYDYCMPIKGLDSKVLMNKSIPLENFCTDNTFGFMLFAKIMTKLNIVINMSKAELISTNKLIGKIFRKALS